MTTDMLLNTEDKPISQPDFMQLLGLLYGQKRLILSVTVTLVLLATLASIWITPKYRVELLMAPVIEENNNASFNNLAAQFGGLASLAGVDLSGGKGDVEQHLAILTSRLFLSAFIKEHQLMPVLFPDLWNPATGTWLVATADEIPTINQAVKLFQKKVLNISLNASTGLVSLMINWTNPQQAAQWANELVRRVNLHLQQQAIVQAEKSVDYLNQAAEKTRVLELRQAIFNLVQNQIHEIMLAKVRDEYVFKVIDPAIVLDPNDYIWPKPLLMIIFAASFGLILGSIFALFLSYKSTTHSARKHKLPIKHQAGFSLIELLIVMVIMGLLASLVGPALFGKVDTAKIKTAQSQMQLFSTAIDTFRLDVGDYPEKLEQLRKSDVPGWDGPYMSKGLPLDPWNTAYLYQVPGESTPYTLKSLGKDGREGGEGNDADIIF